MKGNIVMNGILTEEKSKIQNKKVLNQGRMFVDDEVAAIIDMFGELVEWLHDQYGNAKELAKQQADKFKKRIEQMKKLNGQPISVQKG